MIFSNAHRREQEIQRIMENHSFDQISENLTFKWILQQLMDVEMNGEVIIG